jgi:hypothetical protein
MACNSVLGIGEPEDPPDETGGIGGGAGTRGQHGGESGEGKGGSGGARTGGSTGSGASGNTAGDSGGGSGGEDAGNGGAGGEEAGNGGVGGTPAGSAGVGGGGAGSAGVAGAGAGGMPPVVVTAIAVEDATIQDETPDQGFASSCQARIDSGFSCLMRWDLSAVPPGSSVQSVGLRVRVLNGTSRPFIAYPLKASWSELNVSWILRDANVPWEVPGARGTLDRGSAVGNFYFVALGDHSQQLDSEWVALVASWVDAPSTNQGILITGAENTDDGISLASKDHAEADYRPRLIVTYLSVAP